MRDRCPKVKKGRRCRRALHFDGLHVYRPPRARGRRSERDEADRAEFARQLEDRSEGWCEATERLRIVAPELALKVCTTGILHKGTDPHHLFPEDRDRGVHDPSRGLWLCRHAHDWAHDHPRLAKSYGLLRPDAAA